MIITTDEDRAKVKAYLKQAAQAQIRVKSEQADLRDILKVLKEEYEIQPTLARKVIGIMDKGNMPEVQETNDNLADLYEIAAH
ncbi:MAG: hypothetical protein OXR68_05495 [Alphaproteobacteria bacterium]|nr:hypothetical protein [Alphaproteobacteria bacterium]MDD9920058.1 hypothetical protein [Alphaproteobacteria bacterium]